MFRMSIAHRMTVGIVMMTVSSILVANLAGILPDATTLQTERKVTLCESLAISCSLLAQKKDAAGISANLKMAAARNKDILSIALRRADGKTVYQVGDHQTHWHRHAIDGGGGEVADRRQSTQQEIMVPIMNGDAVWGDIEVAFEQRLAAFLPMVFGSQQYLALVCFCGLLNAMGIYLYLRRTLTYLDPSQAVPDRVRTALDTLAEGLLVLDNEQRIVLANKSFSSKVGLSADELQGTKIDHLDWQARDTNNVRPWQQTAIDNQAAIGAKLALGTREEGERVFLINSSPILNEQGERKGVIASFDDITPLEEKKLEMQSMLQSLRVSREEIKQQNRELQILATRDALTGCLNRRSFFEMFEQLWNGAKRHNQSLSCIMLDIDHFKSINDTFGHSMGDEVLQKVAHALQKACRSEDIFCRYGGEEFCLLTPHLTAEQCEQASERMRTVVTALSFSDDSVRVTVSLGVSAIDFGALDPQELLDQADKAMYVAKRTGRDRTRRWDSLTEDDLIENQEIASPRDAVESQPTDATIPFPAVASLLSALSFRDQATAAHSTRVAELCVLTARGLMSVKEAYILEIAALLHDIGKIGVPDRILLKPGPLTEAEWRIMEVHDQIGVDIVDSSFPNQQLVDIVRFHHATFTAKESTPDMPAGDDIPLGARIVTIADAYDAMVSDRVYRKGRCQEEAFAELRRCSGSQFDGRLVERFIAVVEDFHGSQSLQVRSKQAALQLGLQIEQLAVAMDRQDVAAISILAGRLHDTAVVHQVPEVEQMSALLKEIADDDPDIYQLVSMTRDLMDLCRSAQLAYIGTTPELLEADEARQISKELV